MSQPVILLPRLKVALRLPRRDAGREMKDRIRLGERRLQVPAVEEVELIVRRSVDVVSIAAQ